MLDPIISDESLEKRIGETISRGKLVLTEVVEDDGAPAGDEDGKGKAKVRGCAAGTCCEGCIALLL